jgi:hypothetical protein
VANAANNGTAKTSPWGGIGGIQRALASIVAGETIYVKSGTDIDLSKLVRLIATATTGAGLVLGAEVAEYTPAVPPSVKGDAEGHIVYVTGNTFYVDVHTGTWTTNQAVCLKSDPGNNYTNAAALTRPGLKPVTAGTSNEARVTIVGTKNDENWTEDGTQVVIDGHTTGDHGIQTLLAWYEVRNVRITRTFQYWGWITILSSRLINCTADHCYRGFSGAGVYRNCLSYSNTQFGFYPDSAPNAHYAFCVAYGNGSSGFVDLTYNSSAIMCLSYDNGGHGFKIVSDYGSCIVACVIDGNTLDGILASGDGYTRVLGCRITNNGLGGTSYYGINATTTQNIDEDYNVFYCNGLDAGATADHDRLHVATGVHSDHAENDTEQGYTNEGGNVFTVTAAAIGRRIAVTLPDGLNTVYITAGLTPAAAAPPAGEVVTGGTAYEGATGAVAASGTRIDCNINQALYTGTPYFGDPDALVDGTLMLPNALPKLIVGGDPDPDVTGEYSRVADTNGWPAYKWDAGNYWLWWDVAGTQFFITDELGGGNEANHEYWDGLDTPLGMQLLYEMAPDSLANGNPLVSYHYAAADPDLVLTTGYYGVIGALVQGHDVGAAAQLAADVADVAAQLGNMTTAVQNLLHADNDGTLDYDGDIITAHALGHSQQHTTDAEFLETNKDEIITADTDILGEFGVTGTAPAGGGGVRRGGALRGA